jgi:hypothetical protein
LFVQKAYRTARSAGGDDTMRKPLIYRDADTGQPSGGTPPPAEPPAQSAATLTQDQFNAALADEKRKWKQAQAAEVAEAARKAAEPKPQPRESLKSSPMSAPRG